MAQDYFLKLTDIEGESQDSKHTNEIDILAYNWGASQVGAGAIGSGSGSGRVQIHDFHFEARHSKASPKLMQACADGSHIGTATLTCRKAGKEQQEYLTITLTDCIVTAYKVVALDDGSGVPMDYFSVGFSKIQHVYKEQKADGTLGGQVQTSWDVKANKAG